MKELYTKFTDELKKAKSIADKYELNDISARAEAYIKDIPNFRVTVPVVGGFSTGKSSLLNFMLGEELLSTNITPETAVPAEITYGDNTAEIISENGTENISIAEYKTFTATAQTRLAKLYSKNSFLSSIPNVKIVDMPGFDSGYELHNRAIDDYLPNSLAYIITVSADEGTLRESIISFLKELKLSEMPVYIVITKSDKVVPDELDEVVAHIKNLISGSLSINNAKVIVTSAEFDENPDSICEIFTEIQRSSDVIFRKNYSQKLYSILLDIYTYLVSLLKKRDDSSEELIDEKERLEESIKNLNDEYIREREHFERQLESVIDSIKAKVTSELSGSRGTIENLLLQGSDVSGKINMIVRNTITAEVNRQLDSKLQKYVNNVSDIINSNMVTLQPNGELLSSEVVSENAAMRNSLNQLVTPVSSTISKLVTDKISTTLIGASLGSFLGPIGTVIGAIAGVMLSGFISNNMRKKEERQRREAAAQKASEIISDVSQNAGGQIESYVLSIRDKINDELEKNIDEKIEIQKKALADAESKLKLNEEEKTAKYNEISSDKQEIEIMMNSVKGEV